MKYVYIEYKLKQKFFIFLSYFIDVTLTGCIMYYVINYRNPLSYGLVIWLITHYTIRFMDFITQKIKDVVGYIQRRSK